MMTGIYVYDWRDKNSGVGVAFKEGENNCNCYNVTDLRSPFHWDTSILAKEKNLSPAEEWKVQQILADKVPGLLEIKYIL